MVPRNPSLPEVETTHYSESRSTSDNSLGWPIGKATDCLGNEGSQGKTKPQLTDDTGLKDKGSKDSEMMKERFAKLLLGEDMSGSGKGVCPALAISNAITNLCATVFGQLWRLEPLSPEKKTMWRREMDLLLCSSNYIVELRPSWQTFPDGTRLEVMTSRPRSDLFINLPALKKLDNMLLEILDGFTNTEFWYVDQGIVAPDSDGSASFRKAVQRQEDKWWLPVPRVPAGGLPDGTRKQLSNKREFASQILKAAMAINSIALAEMDVPDSYLETLPKNGRACLGEVIYRYITSEHFSSECLLDCLDLSFCNFKFSFASTFVRCMDTDPSAGLRNYSQSNIKEKANPSSLVVSDKNQTGQASNLSYDVDVAFVHESGSLSQEASEDGMEIDSESTNSCLNSSSEEKSIGINSEHLKKKVSASILLDFLLLLR